MNTLPSSSAHPRNYVVTLLVGFGVSHELVVSDRGWMYEVRQEEVGWSDRACMADPQSQTRGLGQGSDFFLPVADFVRKPASQGSRKREAAFDDTEAVFGQAFPAACNTAACPHLLKMKAGRQH